MLAIYATRAGCDRKRDAGRALPLSSSDHFLIIPLCWKVSSRDRHWIR